MAYRENYLAYLAKFSRANIYPEPERFPVSLPRKPDTEQEFRIV